MCSRTVAKYVGAVGVSASRSTWTIVCMRQAAVLHIFVQLLLALNHIHGRGIMHRYFCVL